MKISIIGTGYVGLVTGTCLSEMGNKVYCVDNDIEKINDLNNNIISIYEPNLKEMVEDNQNKENLFFTNDLKNALDSSDICFIAVGTPMNDDGSANLSYVYDVASNIGKNISKEMIIVVKSTVPIGTSDKIKSIISNEINKRNIEINFDIIFNPEFLKEGNAVNDFMRPDRIIIGGGSNKTQETLRELYNTIVMNHDRLIFMDVKSAEMTKYASNAMLATRISFMNEIANICEKTGANIKNVRIGVGSDKRIGYDYLYAGCGYGGSCFPKDIRSLISVAKENDYSPILLNSVEEVNENQKNILINKIFNRFGKDLSKYTFAIWGLSFKAETDDVRDAFSIDLIKNLIDSGAKIKAYDPKAIRSFKNVFGENNNISYFKNKNEAIKDADALILLTEWKEFRLLDFEELSKNLSNNIIFDGRNIYNRKFIEENNFELYQIGC
ncbi:UDP-glucose dehydrogenase family protein [Methanobrevibacter sp. DSM 116169]|uniref:UDP-glucose dehydrogenase family protein n=1 Tax=Methanobrevibacter sp. DSM 116169 TaxID=3242727 RepID=UPI0038FC1E96